MRSDTNVGTGIAELDDVLGGGLIGKRVYLIQGAPGCGKTTLALQFLLEGVRNGETVLYVTLAESQDELKANAASHGWSLDHVHFCELIANELDQGSDQKYTMFHPAEVELDETTKTVIAHIEKLNPSRVVIDSMAEIKLLSQNTLRYRREVLALKTFFQGRNCTTLFLDDKTASDEEDRQLQSIAHGVFNLEQLAPEYGAERRRLRVTKFRGRKYRGGYHDFAISRGGLSIFPRLVAGEHVRGQDVRQLSSGLPELDKLLGGGIELGTSLLLLGPAGAGKSSLGLQLALNAALGGERAAIFTFDERLETIRQRASGIGQQLDVQIDKGLVSIQTVDPAELSPGQFAHIVRAAAEGRDGQSPARVVMIDSLNGYLNAMPEEKFLTAQLHELLTYLGHLNVVTILVVAQHGLLGNAMQAPLDTSYLADGVILFRYFEAHGEVRQTIAVVKKRTGHHERSIREFKMDKNGIRVGAPLKDFQGVLTGTPIYRGGTSDLIAK
ncbi:MULTISPECIES: ATPase domain-containing protein [Asticcacaulis]|uniref:ATPase domain-containing protein n=1 Tax=Asticcacaulis TaxID=76890 RepID=UPI001AE211F7|nr:MULTISPECIES: ATPase domain-containing protein [Asticcacaulis]MBP2160355.1 circadian clock protein KaiC [Asticcacaulis solisilvae]MDR6801342.1 circadian clock protein KaiC [Asticcacaulis sp. BE141]